MLLKGDFGPLYFPFENYDHVSKGDFGPKKLILLQDVDFGPLSKEKYIGPKSPFRSNSYMCLELLQTLFGTKNKTLRTTDD